MIRLLKYLIGTTLIAMALVPFAFFLPVMFLIAKDPDVRIAVFFAAPFSASVPLKSNDSLKPLSLRHQILQSYFRDTTLASTCP